MKKKITIACFMILLFACSAPKPIVVQNTAPRIIEKERVITKPFDVVWQSAIVWFATHNTPIKNLDKSSGLISTEYSVPMGEARQYMSCQTSTSYYNGKIEYTNYTGNFNVILKKLSDNTTKVNVNVFFGCIENRYKEVIRLLGANETVLESSTRINCSSNGSLERQILNSLEASSE